MVIGVEGNVHVGKTTYIEHNFIGYYCINEIKFVKNLKDYDRQLYYIDEERKKAKLINSIDGNIVLDRTILSTLIYCFCSQKFSNNELLSLNIILSKNILNKNVCVPNIINFIIYPYDLINVNQKLIGKKKKTQMSLVDYNYYISYSLFFSNLIHDSYNIINYNNYRQILSYNDLNICQKIIKDNLIDSSLFKIEKRVLLDGAPAIGKSTIGKTQREYEYIEECKYKQYTIEDYSNQLESIIYRINLLKNNNVLIDTSFLMGITNLFYRVTTTKEFKLHIIDKIMQSVSMLYYCTNIIYLITDKNILYNRKTNDSRKKRLHFEDNLNYLEKEINFYYKIKNRLKLKSNINIIDASGTIAETINQISSLEHKPLFLVDLFYTIRELIVEDEI